MQYSFVIKYKPGILNWADALSRCPDYQSKDNFTQEIGLPSHVFTNTMTALNYDTTILNAQKNNPEELHTILSKYPIVNNNGRWTCDQ